MALAQTTGAKKVTVRDAYYQGASGIIPVIIVSFVLLLCLLPAVLGSTVIGITLQTAAGPLEITLASVAAGLLLFVSFVLFVMFWPAFYIASLPQTRPIQALRSAKVLTKKRRLSIMRKIAALGVILAVVLLAILLPIALIAAVITPYIVYGTLFVAFAFMHVYLYQLYRSLL